MRSITPSAEVSLRHDGGDAETGTGVEVGAGLRYTVGAVTIEAQVRTLVAHEAAGYEEWGVSGAIRVTPSPAGRGLTLSIAPAWGRTGSATDRLWSAHDAHALGEDSEFEAASQLEIDAGYGFGLPGSRGVLTPYAGMTLGDAGNRTVRTGIRWQLGPDTVVGVEATRQASDAGEADNQVMLRAALQFGTQSAGRSRTDLPLLVTQGPRTRPHAVSLQKVRPVLPGAPVRAGSAENVMPELTRKLRTVAESDDVEAIDALIEAGADPNAKNHAGNTALHAAAYQGSVGAIRALLAAGALRNARNVYGATALDIAMREGRDDAADALRDA